MRRSPLAPGASAAVLGAVRGSPRNDVPLRHAVERSLGDDLDMIGQPMPKPANGLKAPPPSGSRKPSLRASRRGRGHRRRPRHERRGHRRVIQITEAKSTKAANIADATRRDRTRNRATKPPSPPQPQPLQLQPPHPRHPPS
jgi:hypothetical protein